MSSLIPHPLSDAEALSLAASYGYPVAKVIQHGNRREVWALHKLYTTVAVANVELRDGGIAHRYCYPDPMEAVKAFLVYNDLSQHPPGPWVKHKGWHNGVFVDDLNPNWSTSK